MVEPGKQLAMWEEEKPKSREELKRDGLHRHTEERRKSRAEALKEMNLYHGSVKVYREKNAYYAYGDFQHCDAEELGHNIIKVYYLLKEAPPKVRGIVKDYGAGIFPIESKDHIDRLKEDQERYGNTRYAIVAGDKKNTIILVEAEAVAHADGQTSSFRVKAEENEEPP